MSVHSLPRPDVLAPERTRSGRWKMLLVMAICAAPVVASYFTYYVIRPQGRTNYGTLIQPTVGLPAASALPLQTLDGQPVDPASLKNQWLFITVAGGACDAQCEAQLYLQRQLRETLGREKERLDWVWLRTGTTPLPDALQQATSAATVLQVDAQQLAAWLQPAPGQSIEDHLYVVDPLGNWMMRFPANIDPKQAKRDLDRLLRASAFWDKPGRLN